MKLQLARDVVCCAIIVCIICAAFPPSVKSGIALGIVLGYFLRQFIAVIEARLSHEPRS